MDLTSAHLSLLSEQTKKDYHAVVFFNQIISNLIILLCNHVTCLSVCAIPTKFNLKRRAILSKVP